MFLLGNGQKMKGDERMTYVKPKVTIYDEEVMKEIEVLASSSCNCSSAGSRVCYGS